MDILRYADQEQVRKYATPRDQDLISSSQINRIVRLKASGYTNDEIATAVGISTSSVIDYLKQERGNS